MNVEILNEKKNIIFSKEKQLDEINIKIEHLKETKKQLSSEIKVGQKAVESYEKSLLEIEEIQ